LRSSGGILGGGERGAYHRERKGGLSRKDTRFYQFNEDVDQKDSEETGERHARLVWGKASAGDAGIVGRS